MRAIHPLSMNLSPARATQWLIRVDGYVAAFQFEGITEIALVDFNAALFTCSWLMEETDEGDLPCSFVIFTNNPDASFQGYALVTDNLAQLGVSEFEGTLIAFHEGVP